MMKRVWFGNKMREYKAWYEKTKKMKLMNAKRSLSNHRYNV